MEEIVDGPPPARDGGPDPVMTSADGRRNADVGRKSGDGGIGWRWNGSERENAKGNVRKRGRNKESGNATRIEGDGTVTPVTATFVTAMSVTEIPVVTVTEILVSVTGMPGAGMSGKGTVWIQMRRRWRPSSERRNQN